MTTEPTTVNQSAATPVDVDKLVTPLLARRDEIRGTVANLRRERARINERIKELVADEVRLERIVRASQPRVKKTS